MIAGAVVAHRPAAVTPPGRGRPARRMRTGACLLSATGRYAKSRIALRASWSIRLAYT